VLATTYPLLDIFLTMLMFFGLVLWAFIVIWCLVDNVRRPDQSGLAKVGWTLLILVLPIFGCLLYVIARPRGGPGGPMALA
jgi:hypothetical protein